jgi:DNA polymerase I-like protein with 3'-5' exonuclease and polymerase domains
MRTLPALKNLVDAVKAKRKKISAFGKNFIRGIAGHPLFCRSEHSALNTLLQSAGAQVAKVWYILYHENMDDIGYVYGEDYETYGFFHDEIQAGCRPDIASVMGEVLCQTAVKAGECLGFRLPTAAEYKTGYTWADTH